MKKEYTKPEAEVCKFCTEEVITLSQSTELDTWDYNELFGE